MDFCSKNTKLLIPPVSKYRNISNNNSHSKWNKFETNSTKRQWNCHLNSRHWMTMQIVTKWKKNIKTLDFVKSFSNQFNQVWYFRLIFFRLSHHHFSFGCLLWHFDKYIKMICINVWNNFKLRRYSLKSNEFSSII